MTALGLLWGRIIGLSPSAYIVALRLFLAHPHRGYPLGQRILWVTGIMAALEALPLFMLLYLNGFRLGAAFRRVFSPPILRATVTSQGCCGVASSNFAALRGRARVASERALRPRMVRNAPWRADDPQRRHGARQ